MSKNVEKGGMKSYASRMKEDSHDYPKGLGADYEVRATEQVVENGMIVNKTVFATVHPSDKFAGMKASDFALENIIAVGALDSLKECQLSVGVPSELADGMEGTVDNVINAVNEAEASDTQNDGGNE
jgi:hypothetical protein